MQQRTPNSISRLLLRPSGVLAILSLSLFIATGGCWAFTRLGVNDFRGWLVAYHSKAGPLTCVEITAFGIAIDTDPQHPGRQPPFGITFAQPSLQTRFKWVEDVSPGSAAYFPGRNLDLAFAGVAISMSESSGGRAWQVYLPYWLLLCATAILPFSLVLSITKRKTAPGCCRHCGYDLRATPNRCPECGMATAAGVSQD